MIVTPLLFEFYLSSVNNIKDFHSYEQKLSFRINWGEEKTNSCASSNSCACKRGQTYKSFVKTSKLSALRTHPNDKLLYIPKSGISRDQTILGFFCSGRAPGA